MRKISFWLTTLANVMMMILVIIGLVKVSTEHGFNINEYAAYQSDHIWDTAWFWIVMGIAALSLVVLIVDYYLEAETLQIVLMSIAVALPLILFGVGYGYSSYGNQLVGILLMGLSLAVGLWPAITLLVSDEHRAKFIYLILSSIWLSFGIYLVVLVFGLIILAIVMGLIGLITAGREGIEVYDKFGNYLGKIYED